MNNIAWPDPLRPRGRKSAAALSVVSPDVSLQHPEPPKRLNAAEKKIWREITGRLRPGWLYSSEHLFEIFVGLVAQQRQLAALISAAEPGSKRHLDLLKLAKSTALAAGNLAGKLRLTPRSTVDRYTPKIAVSTVAPWELGQRDDAEPEPAA
jgi:hypothetical protein